VQRNRVSYFHALSLSGIKRALFFSRSLANCSKKRSSSISSARVSKCTALVASGTSSRRASFWRASRVFLEMLIFILCFVVAIWSSVSKVYHLCQVLYPWKSVLRQDKVFATFSSVARRWESGERFLRGRKSRQWLLWVVQKMICRMTRLPLGTPRSFGGIPRVE